MDLFGTILLYGLGGFAILCWSCVLFIFCLFGYAKYRGWLTDELTPAEIMERIGNERKNGV